MQRKARRKHLLILSVIPALLLFLPFCGKKLYTDLDAVQFRRKMGEGIPVYDIRRPDEWRQTGIVQGSVMLTFVDGSGRLVNDFFPRFTAAVAKDQPVILICRTGSRTSYLAQYLTEKMGYTKVYHVQHGIVDWMRGGNPTVKP